MPTLALMSSLALPVLQGYDEDTRIAAAVADIKRIEMAIERFKTVRDDLPASLSDVGQTDMDPWGNAYVFQDLSVARERNIRRDRI